ncbi:MAG: hypothetical protein OXH14_19280 [Alphaproteobacteria bacterium]|nr:hypothetical protein [Alphaproteobacteria bacterium]MYE60144.1 hypothetical protein [Alphaproteobacteria bacterium]
MAANSPDTPLSAVEIQELRRLLAEQRRPGWRADPLAATLVGVFAAGFLALFGWMAFQTHANSAAIAVLQTEVAALHAGQRELKAGQEALKADMAELRAGLQELKALILEQKRR